MKPKMRKLLGNVLYWAVLLSMTGLTLFLLRGLCRMNLYEVFTIPTSSMEPTLLPGDRIGVDKRELGARFYSDADYEGGELPVFERRKGRRSLQAGQVAVFNHPYGWQNRRIGFKWDKVYAKRCLGCPGDTVGLRDGWCWNARLERTLHVEAVDMHESRYLMGDEGRQADFSQMSNEDIGSRFLHPGWLRNIDTSWTVHDFGPLYVPRRGDTIVLTPRHWRAYGYLVEYETGQPCLMRGDTALLGDSLCRVYVFKHDYYFFVGDNIANSNDSRHWGFVPDDFIIGIAGRVVWSKDRTTGRLRRDRLWGKIE